MPSIDQIIWLAFLVGVPIALVLHFVLNARRRKQVEAFARHQGFEFVGEDPGLERTGLVHLPIIQLGCDRRFLNVTRGRIRGREIVLFDYRQRVGGLATTLSKDSILADAFLGIEKNRAPTWYDMSIVALRVPKVSEPDRVRIRGEPGHTRIERAGEWLAAYRFDRRMPAKRLRHLIELAVDAAERTDDEACD